MRKLSIEKKQLQTHKIGELGSKIRDLRIGLRLLQSQFAQKLGVSRTQVVAWEGASGSRPSTDHLIQMARLATDTARQVWFLERAGIDLAYFSNAVTKRLGKQVFFKPNEFMEVPIISNPDEMKAAPVGDVTPLSLPWLVKALPHPESTFALRARLGSNFSDSESSFVVVDAFPRDFWTLIGTWVAVHFKDITLPDSPDEVKERIQGFFVGPLLFKVLNVSIKSPLQLPWIIGLGFPNYEDSSYQFHPLSRKIYGDPSKCKLEERLRPGCTLIGEVIGWTR
jgi:transcriptional regulator with XRE-family HTH domain